MPKCELCGKEEMILANAYGARLCSNCALEITHGKRCAICGKTDDEIPLIHTEEKNSDGTFTSSTFCENCRDILANVKAARISSTSTQQESSCFIATAAYGTPLDPKLDILRNFRDIKLKPNATGKALVNLYYRISPPFAKLLARSSTGRKIVRFFLNGITSYLDKN